MHKNVIIILINYHGHDDTLECILSVFKSFHQCFKLFVVDNSVGRQSVDILMNQLSKHDIDFNFLEEVDLNQEIQTKKLNIIKANENRGFAAANNIVLKYFVNFSIGADYFWVLNNDTVITPEAMTEMISYFEQNHEKRLGILGATMLYYDDKQYVQGVGGGWNKTLLSSYHIAEGKTLDEVQRKHHQIDYVIGASMFVSQQFLNEVGVLNEYFFLYFEELDWSMRAYKKNTRLIILPQQ